MMSVNSKSRLSLQTDLHSTLIYPTSIPRSSPTYTPQAPSLPLLPCSSTYSCKNTTNHFLSTSPDITNHPFADYDQQQQQQSCRENEDSQLMDATPSVSPSLSSSSSPTLSPTSNFSSMDLHYLYDQYQYPSPQTFDAIIQDYLQNLSTKKRDKALVDQQRYALILQVLKDPRNTAISTAQFRFWVKKMFQLSSIKVESQPQEPASLTWMVCHDGKPVATQEQIYPILIRAHRDAHHGGRDKTSSLVRKQYSWIPKELIARFVRRCPFCISRRNGHLSRPSRQQLSTHLNHQATLPKAKTNINKSASCFDHQSTIKSNSLTNGHQSQYHHHHQQKQKQQKNHHHHHQSMYPYHFGERGASTKSQHTSSTWEDASHPHDRQPLNSNTPTIAASIATTAAVSAVSTQWMEPGTPFYYYSPSSSRDFFVSGADHLHNSYTSASTTGSDYSSSYLSDHDGTRNNSFDSSMGTAATTNMYTGSYQSSSSSSSSPPIHSSSTHSSPSVSPSASANYTLVEQQQQYEYLIQPLPSSMDATHLLPEGIKIENTTTTSPSYHYPYSSSSSSSSSSSDLYALPSPTGSMDLLSHQHQQHQYPSV